MISNNKNTSSKVKSIIKYTTSIATVSFLLYKLYDTYTNSTEDEDYFDQDDDLTDNNYNNVDKLNLEQFDELIKAINKPLLDELKQYKKLIKKSNEDTLKMKYWKALSEKTIILLLNYLITNKVINLVLKDQKVTTTNKKIIIYTYLKIIVKSQLKILNNSIKLNEEEEPNLVIMKVVSFKTFNNLIKQNVLDNNLDNISMFLNFNNTVLKESISELEQDDVINGVSIERTIRSVQNDIVKILFDNNYDSEYKSLSDYLDVFNESFEENEDQQSDSENVEGKFAMFITLLIKKLDKKLSQ
ncbi:hypothetical protein HANVADRAFT_54201 [Hanseniaspora valbyensis NRRL Y-1626]|uniref:Uncharacterized protein n=1 Tax=Hanseniaspora valbyensis NRRL Y-1626 TaxID=766949 RepID=A0A1B7T8D2_9ASCO|nr:hypothetical protein HANVADRAFT_54201 [Hanseniaspora valbyensis NRRL Y-1626]